MENNYFYWLNGKYKSIKYFDITSDMSIILVYIAPIKRLTPIKAISTSTEVNVYLQIAETGNTR